MNQFFPKSFIKKAFHVFLAVWYGMVSTEAVWYEPYRDPCVEETAPHRLKVAPLAEPIKPLKTLSEPRLRFDLDITDPLSKVWVSFTKPGEGAKPYALYAVPAVPEQTTGPDVENLSRRFTGQYGGATFDFRVNFPSKDNLGDPLGSVELYQLTSQHAVDFVTNGLLVTHTLDGMSDIRLSADSCTTKGTISAKGNLTLRTQESLLSLKGSSLSSPKRVRLRSQNGNIENQEALVEGNEVKVKARRFVNEQGRILSKNATFTLTQEFKNFDRSLVASSGHLSITAPLFQNINSSFVSTKSDVLTGKAYFNKGAIFSSAQIVNFQASLLDLKEQSRVFSGIQGNFFINELLNNASFIESGDSLNVLVHQILRQTDGGMAADGQLTIRHVSDSFSCLSYNDPLHKLYPQSQSLERSIVKYAAPPFKFENIRSHVRSRTELRILAPNGEIINQEGIIEGTISHIEAKKFLNERGVITAQNNTLLASYFENRGGILTGNDVVLKTTVPIDQKVTEEGAWKERLSKKSLMGHVVNSSGFIVATDSVILDVAEILLNNNGLIKGGKGVDINALVIGNFNGGQISAGSSTVAPEKAILHAKAKYDLYNHGDASISSSGRLVLNSEKGKILNQKNSLIHAQEATLTALSIENLKGGKIKAGHEDAPEGAELTINVRDDLNNHGETSSIFSSGGLTLNSGKGKIRNQDSALIQAQKALIQASERISNEKKASIRVENALDLITPEGLFINTNSDVVAGRITFNGGDFSNVGKGTIDATDTLIRTTGATINQQGSRITAQNALNIESLYLNNLEGALSGKSILLDLGNKVHNDFYLTTLLYPHNPYSIKQKNEKASAPPPPPPAKTAEDGEKDKDKEKNNDEGGKGKDQPTQSPDSTPKGPSDDAKKHAPQSKPETGCLINAGGRIEAQDTLKMAGTGDFYNSDGASLSCHKGSMDIHVFGRMMNQDGSTIFGNQGLTITTDEGIIYNGAKSVLKSGERLTLKSAKVLNEAGGLIKSVEDLVLFSKNLFFNVGQIKTKRGDIYLNSLEQLQNVKEGIIDSGGMLTATAVDGIHNLSSLIKAKGNIFIEGGSLLSNTGSKLVSLDGNLTISKTTDVYNASGGIETKGDINLVNISGLYNAEGTIASGNNINVTGLEVHSPQNPFNGQGLIKARKQLDIEGATISPYDIAGTIEADTLYLSSPKVFVGIADFPLLPKVNLGINRLLLYLPHFFVMNIQDTILDYHLDLTARKFFNKSGRLWSHQSLSIHTKDPLVNGSAHLEGGAPTSYEFTNDWDIKNNTETRNLLSGEMFYYKTKICPIASVIGSTQALTLSSDSAVVNTGGIEGQDRVTLTAPKITTGWVHEVEDTTLLHEGHTNAIFGWKNWFYESQPNYLLSHGLLTINGRNGLFLNTMGTIEAHQGMDVHNCKGFLNFAGQINVLKQPPEAKIRATHFINTLGMVATNIIDKRYWSIDYANTNPAFFSIHDGIFVIETEWIRNSASFLYGRDNVLINGKSSEEFTQAVNLNRQLSCTRMYTTSGTTSHTETNRFLGFRCGKTTTHTHWIAHLNETLIRDTLPASISSRGSVEAKNFDAINQQGTVHGSSVLLESKGSLTHGYQENIALKVERPLPLFIDGGEAVKSFPVGGLYQKDDTNSPYFIIQPPSPQTQGTQLSLTILENPELSSGLSWPPTSSLNLGAPDLTWKGKSLKMVASPEILSMILIRQLQQSYNTGYLPSFVSLAEESKRAYDNALVQNHQSVKPKAIFGKEASKSLSFLAKNPDTALKPLLIIPRDKATAGLYFQPQLIDDVLILVPIYYPELKDVRPSLGRMDGATITQENLELTSPANGTIVMKAKGKASIKAKIDATKDVVIEAEGGGSAETRTSTQTVQTESVNYSSSGRVFRTETTSTSVKHHNVTKSELPTSIETGIGGNVNIKIGPGASFSFKGAEVISGGNISLCGHRFIIEPIEEQEVVACTPGSAGGMLSTIKPRYVRSLLLARDKTDVDAGFYENLGSALISGGDITIKAKNKIIQQTLGKSYVASEQTESKQKHFSSRVTTQKTTGTVTSVPEMYSLKGSIYGEAPLISLEGNTGALGGSVFLKGVDIELKNRAFLNTTTVHSNRSTVFKSTTTSSQTNRSYLSPTVILASQDFIIEALNRHFEEGVTIQTGRKIHVDAGNFVVISGMMNSPIIEFEAAREGVFHNTNLTRQEEIPSKPAIVNLTDFTGAKARYGQADRGAIFGHTYVPKEEQVITVASLETQRFYESGMEPKIKVSDPLQDLVIQRALSEVAGKVYGEDDSSASVSERLWANAGKWRQQTQKSIITRDDLKDAPEAMLLYELEQVGTVLRQHILLYLPPNEINPYRSPGDISCEEGYFTTGGDQAHLNNRIVGKHILQFKSGGKLTRKTEKHLVVSEQGNTTTHQEMAKPQQKFICLEGDVTTEVKGDSLSEATHTEAGRDILDTVGGTLTNKEIVLNTTTVHTEEDEGTFSSTTTTETNSTNAILPNTRIAGRNITTKAAQGIQFRAAKETAGEALTYEGPLLNSEAVIAVDTHSKTTEKSSIGLDTTSSSRTQSATVSSTEFNAPVLNINTKQATFTGTDFIALVLNDNTDQGMKCGPTLQTLHYSQKMVSESALAKTDVGCQGWYEVMQPCRFMVNQVIRNIDEGEIKLESVLWDKDRTQIIGKFAETTYELKKWHTEWAKHEQLIPDEALVVVALAITIATQGAGASLMNGLSGTLFGMVPGVSATGAAIMVPAVSLTTTGAAMASAGFTTLCVQATTSFLRTGDLTQVAKGLTSKEGIKSLAISIASAGIANKLGGMLDVNMNPGLKSFTEHLQEHAIRNGSSFAVNTVAGQKVSSSTVIKTVADTVIDAVAARAANNRSALPKDTLEASALHKVAHAVDGFCAGYVSGLVSGEDPVKKGTARGFGSSVGEIFAEGFTDKGETNPAILNRNSNIARIVTTGLGVALGMDGNTVFQGADCSINNNHMTSVGKKKTDEEEDEDKENQKVAKKLIKTKETDKQRSQRRAKTTDDITYTNNDETSFLLSMLGKQEEALHNTINQPKNLYYEIAQEATDERQRKSYERDQEKLFDQRIEAANSEMNYRKVLQQVAYGTIDKSQALPFNVSNRFAGQQVPKESVQECRAAPFPIKRNRSNSWPTIATGAEKARTLVEESFSRFSELKDRDFRQLNAHDYIGLPAAYAWAGFGHVVGAVDYVTRGTLSYIASKENDIADGADTIVRRGTRTLTGNAALGQDLGYSAKLATHGAFLLLGPKMIGAVPEASMLGKALQASASTAETIVNGSKTLLKEGREIGRKVADFVKGPDGVRHPAWSQLTENPGALNAGANDVFVKNMQVIRNTIDQQGDQWLKSSPSLHQPFIEEYIQSLNKVLDKHAIPHTVGSGRLTQGTLNTNSLNPIIPHRQDKLLQWANRHHPNPIYETLAQEIKKSLQRAGHVDRSVAIKNILADFEARRGFFTPLEELPVKQPGRGQKSRIISERETPITVKATPRTPEQAQRFRDFIRKTLDRVEEQRVQEALNPSILIEPPIFWTYLGQPRLRLIEGGENLAQGTILKVKTRIDGQLFQDHHIISHTNIHTKNHDLIKLAGFDLESRANKIFLPTTEGAEVSTTERSIHEGRHIDLVSERLSIEMDKAIDLGTELGWNQEQYHAQLMKIISEERKILKSGDRILNKNHRPFATDGGRVVPKDPKE